MHHLNSKTPHTRHRPIVLGVVLFLLFNLFLTVGVSVSPLNRKFNFSYGNYLPTKLEMLRQQHPEQLDVLFLGTSQTNNGFIPSVFEKASPVPLNSFNLGLPNNRYDIMQSVLQAHIHRYGKPRMVFLELGPSIQEKDTYFYYLPALYYRTLIEQNPAMAGQWLSNPLLSWTVKKELFLSSLSSLHQYRFTFSPLNILGKVAGKLQPILSPGANSETPSLNTLDVDTVEASSGTAHKVSSPSSGEAIQGDSANPLSAISPSNAFVITDKMTAKGWYPKDQSPNMRTPAGVRLSVEEARQYYIEHQTGVYFDKLEALLTYCRKENIPVTLVSWPNHPAFNRVFKASILHSRYQTGLRELLQKMPTPVINLNQHIPRDQAESQAGFFADPRHLTPEGAARISQALAQDFFALPQTRQRLWVRQRTAQKPSEYTLGQSGLSLAGH